MTAETWSAIAAFIALSGSFLAWKAAAKSADAASRLTEIERRRWHHEMTPQLRAAVVAPKVWDNAELRLLLLGPTALHEVTLTVSIRDDWPDRKSTLAGGPTADEIAATIWGPYRFNRAIDGGSEDGRSVETFRLTMGDYKPIALIRSAWPRWTNQDHWRTKYADAPVRIAVTCEHPDYEPWTVHLEVPVDIDEQAFFKPK
ncbi:hypothetical protein [Acrocarpospora phusangensis]|nr:hypothetical protein [Acrocarpospora phusangensis]